MKVLFIFNDAPCGSERIFNAPRLVHALSKQKLAAEMTVFLMADAVLAAKVHQ
jgi:uncharacterized protein involved in oxidation of intracellular sulfur